MGTAFVIGKVRASSCPRPQLKLLTWFFKIDEIKSEMPVHGNPYSTRSPTLPQGLLPWCGGLSFRGKYAVVTLSKPRHDSFHGLPLDDRLEQRGAEAQCGLQIIDLDSGAVAHWLRLDGTLVTELYDAVVLPGVRQPMAVGFQTNEIERLVVIDPPGQL